MKKRVYRKIIKDLLFMLAGTGILALAIAGIYDPAGIVTGGFTGIAIIVKTLSAQFLPFEIPLWLTNLLLNTPVFIVGYFLCGKRFIERTLIGNMMLSGWLYIFPAIDIAKGDHLLAALYGGVMSGFAMGLIFRAQATTGGTDMVAALVAYKRKEYNVVQVMQILDALIVILGMFVFGMHAAMYALIAVFVSAKMSNTILDGMKYAKAVHIVTAKHELIAQEIMDKLSRGVTGISAQGMYTGNEMCMLYCVVAPKQIVKLKEIVYDCDSSAFLIVSDAKEVFGEGFLRHSNNY